MGIGVRLGKGLAGCGGVLGAGLGLSSLLGWRGHSDGMAVDGNKRKLEGESIDGNGAIEKCGLDVDCDRLVFC